MARHRSSTPPLAPKTIVARAVTPARALLVAAAVRVAIAARVTEQISPAAAPTGDAAKPAAKRVVRKVPAAGGEAKGE
jgi:hypothetical protein